MHDMLCNSCITILVGDDVPLERSSQEERLAAGGSTVPREEDEIEEQVEEEQPTSYPAGLTEFQSQTAKQTVDLSVHRKKSDGGSGQQGKMAVEKAAVVESKLPSPPPPHEEDRQSQHASNLSNASKSSMRSMSEGNLKEPSKSSLRADLKNGSNSSVKDDSKDASRSSLKSSLKDDSKTSMKSDASKASSGSHVSASSRKSKGAASTSSKASVKSSSGVVQKTASGGGSIHASGEEGKSDTLPEPTASHNPSVEEGGSSEQESEKAEVSKTTGLEDSRVDEEEGGTEEQLLKQEGEVAVSNRLHEGESPETDNQETLTGSSIQVRVTHVNPLSVHTWDVFRSLFVNTSCQWLYTSASCCSSVCRALGLRSVQHNLWSANHKKWVWRTSCSCGLHCPLMCCVCMPVSVLLVVLSACTLSCHSPLF